MKEALTTVLGSLVRHGMTAVGGATVVAGSDDVTQVAGAIVTIVGFILSLIRARKG